MATTYSGSIDRSPAGNSPSLNCIAGSGGVTTKQPVKFDGTTSLTVIACSATSDFMIGVAETTESAGDPVKVYLNGAIIESDQTLTEGGLVGVDASGVLEDWAADTVAGLVVKAVTGKSQVLLNIEYK